MRFECAYTKLVNIDELKSHPSNANKHPEKQIQALAKIIARNGQRSPIVVSNQSGYIVKGHGRVEALKQLGWVQCAVDYQDYKDEVEEFRDRIADNEVARYAEFDKEMFEVNLDELKIDKFDVDLDFEEFGLIDFEFKEENEKEKKEKTLLDNQEFLIVISCKDELDQQDLFQEFQTREIECKLMN